jgi:hypothetical protein
MTKSKAFDAVEMKNAIQAKRHRDRAGLSDEQVRQSIAQRLRASDHPLCRKWRKIEDFQSSRIPTIAPKA